VAEPIGPVDQGEDEDVAGDEDLKKAYQLLTTWTN